MNNSYISAGITSSTLVYQTALACQVQPGAKLPERQHPTDAGADLFSMETLEILPNEQKLVDTGIAIKIPRGFAGFIFNRSSQGKNGISIPNSVGVIDSDYRGNLKVLLKNNSQVAYEITAGDRIAQLVVQRIELPVFYDAWNDTQRGLGGFGSTGTT